MSLLDMQCLLRSLSPDGMYINYFWELASGVTAVFPACCFLFLHIYLFHPGMISLAFNDALHDLLLLKIYINNYKYYIPLLLFI